MTTQQATAFDKLLEAKDKYIEEHRSEVDQGGTIRGMRTMGSMWILEDLFRTDVVHFERKQWPALSAKRSQLAEQVLQHAFQKKIAELKQHEHDEFMEDAVKPDGLMKAEDAWLNFRSAWKAFAQLRYPAQADAIVAKITLDRARYIKTI